MTQLVEHIRNNVKNNSDRIKAIKDQASQRIGVYINPNHQLWGEYRGRKHEVTKWLIALHQAKSEFHKIKYHLYRKGTIEQPREALKSMLELKEKIEKCEGVLQ